MLLALLGVLTFFSQIAQAGGVTWELEVHSEPPKTYAIGDEDFAVPLGKSVPWKCKVNASRSKKDSEIAGRELECSHKDVIVRTMAQCAKDVMKRGPLNEDGFLMLEVRGAKRHFFALTLRCNSPAPY